MATPAKTPVQEPITGREDWRDVTQPQHALSEFYRAFNTRDLELMQENWSHANDISMDNPLGGIKRGWPEIRAVYERIFAGTARVEVAFSDYTQHVVGDTFYAVGRERGRFADSTQHFDLAFRTTRVFHLTNGRWRQVHHHGSIDDPALLDSYQKAIHGQSSAQSQGLTHSETATSSPISRASLLSAELDKTASVRGIQVSRLDLGAGQATGLHLHPCAVTGYILAGSIQFQIEGQPAQTLHPGDSFFEPAGVRIAHFDNASTADPASFVAVYLLPESDTPLIQMLT